MSRVCVACVYVYCLVSERPSECKILAQVFLRSLVEGTEGFCTITLGVLRQLARENEFSATQEEVSRAKR